MLDAIDDIAWGELTHAYGSAEDVPAMLLRLGSHDEPTRDRALNQAYGNIFHQGTRYEATAYAVPFLLKMVCDPEYPNEAKRDVLYLLGRLVVGDEEDYVPEGFAEAIREMRADLEEMEAATDEERARFPKDLAGLGNEEDWCRWLVRITDEARAGVDLVTAQLQNEHFQVRIASCFVLSFLPESFEDFSEALWQNALDDDHEFARGNALLALALSSSGRDIRRYVGHVEAMLDDDLEFVRFSAAALLGTRFDGVATSRVREILADVIQRSGPNLPEGVNQIFPQGGVPQTHHSRYAQAVLDLMDARTKITDT